MEKNKVDIALIERYVRGELGPREMYALERRAQDDPALMDIILGMELEAQEVHAVNLADIRKRVAKRTQRERTRRLAPAERWAVAASVLLALTFGTLWFTRQEAMDQRQPTLASAPRDGDTQRSERQAAPEADDTPGDSPAAKQPARLPAPPTEKSTSTAEEKAYQTPQRLARAAEEPALETANIRPAKTLAAASESLVDSPAHDTNLLRTAEVLDGRASGVVMHREIPKSRPAADSVAVAFQPVEAEHSEVDTTTQPRPEKGWRAYNRYLRQETKQAEDANGTITLAFTIADNGTPTDIRVVHTTDSTLGERAIQLVREGGKWKPGENGERNVELQIAF